MEKVNKSEQSVKLVINSEKVFTVLANTILYLIIIYTIDYSCILK